MTLGISVIVVGSLLAVAVIEQSRLQGDQKANLVMAFDSGASWQADESWFVPFTVTNRGSEAISSADLRIEIYRDDALVESKELTVEFLPLQGTQDGVYVTRLDPATHDLRWRLVSVQFP